jgi:endoglucanase
VERTLVARIAGACALATTFSWVVLGVACARTPDAPHALASPPSHGSKVGNPALRRGMNLGDALDAPTEGAWGVVLGASDFVSVREAGFDHIRLPVRFSTHAASSPPYTIDPVFLDRVDWAVKSALDNRLAVIVDVHHYEEMEKRPDAERPRFLAIWRQLAEHYRAWPPSVCFELLNEPNSALTAPTWNAILAEALPIVRAANPTRLIVLEGVGWASAQSLRDTLAIPEGDPNLVGSFHMYQPILFTHQGADFMPPEFGTKGVVFPGPPPAPLAPVPAADGAQWVHDWFVRYDTLPAQTNPSGPATIADQLDMAATFAERRHLPVYMGEFAAIDHADPQSRALWTRMTRVEAERRGFGWAYWDDGGRFKAYVRSDRSWVSSLKAALLE